MSFSRPSNESDEYTDPRCRRFCGVPRVLIAIVDPTSRESSTVRAPSAKRANSKMSTAQDTTRSPRGIRGFGGLLHGIRKSRRKRTRWFYPQVPASQAAIALRSSLIPNRQQYQGTRYQEERRKNTKWPLNHMTAHSPSTLAPTTRLGISPVGGFMQSRVTFVSVAVCCRSGASTTDGVVATDRLSSHRQENTDVPTLKGRLQKSQA